MTRYVTIETNMASPSPLDSFFATFTGLKSVLYRNGSLLAIIMFPLTYQMAIIGFLIEEEASGACNKTGEFNCNDSFNYLNRNDDRVRLLDHLSFGIILDCR